MNKTARSSGQPVPYNSVSMQTSNMEMLAKEAQALKEIQGENWISQLLEYRDHAKGQSQVPPFEDVTVSTGTTHRFYYNVTVSERTETFGGRSVTFKRKKDAKQYASKLAVGWLLQHGYLLPDGTVAQPVSSTARAASPPPPSLLYTQQVPLICHSLGFNAPRYMIEVDKGSQSMFSGYAVFSGNVPFSGPVGHVSQIFTKKGAKEKCAENIYKLLKPIEQDHRNLFKQSRPWSAQTSPSAVPDEPSSSFTSQVPILCVKLGFHAPTYVIERVEGSSSMFNAHAVFRDNVHFPGKVGFVTNAFNKKVAREQCAENVYALLQSVEAKGANNRPRSEVETRQSSDSEEAILHTTSVFPASTTFTSHVPELCYRLGLSPPQYKIEKVPGSFSLFDIYAIFPDEIQIDGRIGEIHGIAGRKNAREQCAELVFKHLKQIETHRNSTMQVDADPGVPMAGDPPAAATHQPDPQPIPAPTASSSPPLADDTEIFIRGEAHPAPPTADPKPASRNDPVVDDFLNSPSMIKHLEAYYKGHN